MAVRIVRTRRRRPACMRERMQLSLIAPPPPQPSPQQSSASSFSTASLSQSLSTISGPPYNPTATTPFSRLSSSASSSFPATQRPRIPVVPRQPLSQLQLHHPQLQQRHTSSSLSTAASRVGPSATTPEAAFDSTTRYPLSLSGAQAATATGAYPDTSSGHTPLGVPYLPSRIFPPLTFYPPPPAPPSRDQQNEGAEMTVPVASEQPPYSTATASLPAATTITNNIPSAQAEVQAEAQAEADITSTTFTGLTTTTTITNDIPAATTILPPVHADLNLALLPEPPGLIPSYFTPPTKDMPFVLNPRSVAALFRLRSYVPPPFPLWQTLPHSRRAAVLILLFADRAGELRVVLTMRSANLRSFSGHAAFPGGKADSVKETEFEIARREAWEEIGLPAGKGGIGGSDGGGGWRVEEVCMLPCSLAKTGLVVRPCVGFLHPPEAVQNGDGVATRARGDGGLMPRLDAKEVAAVFSAPFHNFLKTEDEPPQPTQPPIRQQQQDGQNGVAVGHVASPLPPGKWYEGDWTSWNNHPWRMHFFYVPVTNQRVTKPAPLATPEALRTGVEGPKGDTDPKIRKEVSEHVAESDAHEGRYKVWGMTARMLVDVATVAYGEEPEFERNEEFGDEGIIGEMAEMGMLGEKKKL